MEIKLNSIRIVPPNWQSEERFNVLMSLLKKYDCGIGEIVFFTSFTHAPITREEMEKRLVLIKERMEKTKKLGYKVGINILATIGHHNEDLDNSIKGDYTNMTGIDGNVCHGSYCMNDQKYLREYVVPVYKMMAETNPDFIWVDDDVRYGHMPIGFGCFCDNCIKIFNEENGTSYTRETLKKELDSGNVDIRKKYLKKNSDSIYNLLKLIGKTVRGISDKIKLGYMTGDRFFEGYEFERYAEALSDNGKYEIMWRPGGGAYQDRCFDEIVDKASSVGRQCAYLPDYVTTIQSEIENFPYDIIQKSPQSTAQEVLLHVAAGCTGAAFNILPGMTENPVCDEPLERIEKHLKKLDEIYKFEKLLSEKIHGIHPCGIHTGWTINSQAAVDEGEWTAIYPDLEFGQYAMEFLDLGFPQNYNFENAEVVMLRHKAASVMSDEEIKKLLSGGVYMDSEALEYINSRGFSKYTGFKVEKEYPVDAIECYLDNEFNVGITGGKRNCRQAFYVGESFGFITTNNRAKVISELVDYRNEKIADCCMGIFENDLGGRVCVAGYYPFNKVSFYQKTVQLKRIFKYLSGDSFLAYVKSHERARLWTYKGEENNYIVLFNITNDAYENIEIAINTKADTAKLYNRFGIENPDEIKITEENGEKILKVEKLLPCEMLLIEL